MDAVRKSFFENETSIRSIFPGSCFSWKTARTQSVKPLNRYFAAVTPVKERPGFPVAVQRGASAKTIALSVISNTYPRAYKGARSNRESVAAL